MKKIKFISCNEKFDNSKSAKPVVNGLRASNHIPYLVNHYLLPAGFLATYVQSQCVVPLTRKPSHEKQHDRQNQPT